MESAVGSCYCALVYSSLLLFSMVMYQDMCNVSRCREEILREILARYRSRMMVVPACNVDVGLHVAAEQETIINAFSASSFSQSPPPLSHIMSLKVLKVSKK